MCVTFYYIKRSLLAEVCKLQCNCNEEIFDTYVNKLNNVVKIGFDTYKRAFPARAWSALRNSCVFASHDESITDEDAAPAFPDSNAIRSHGHREHISSSPEGNDERTKRRKNKRKSKKLWRWRIWALLPICRESQSALSSRVLSREKGAVIPLSAARHCRSHERCNDWSR